MFMQRFLTPVRRMFGGMLATSRIAIAPVSALPMTPAPLAQSVARRLGKDKDYSIPRQKTARQQPHGKMRLFRNYQPEERTMPE